MTSTAALRTRNSWTWLPEFAAEQLPRYTSYPPANRFDATTDAMDADTALRTLAPGSRLSLYLHIPYCRALCWYCGCHTSVPTRADPVAPYLAALRMEIARVARLVPDSCVVASVHFGGGSPDILPPEDASRIMQLLRDSFRFDPMADIAAELDPRGASAELVEALQEGGLNRVSFGVQTLDPAIQKAINRIQPAEEVADAIARVRAAGVAAVNLDLMYGLPLQTVQHVIDAAMFAAMEEADRVAVFGYAHVPWFKKHQGGIRTDDLPSGEQRFRQAEAAAATLEAAGYVAVGFDHFATIGDSLERADRLGALRRNFQGYTDDAADALIGFGASAISSLPGLYVQNTPDTHAYRAAMSEDRSAAVRGLRLTAEDVRIANLIEQVLCRFEADIPADMRIWARPRLSRLADAGLIQLSGDHLTVTARGRPYVRNVAAAFDPTLVASRARHSLAI